MNKSILATALTLLISQSVFAEDYKIASGADGGAYDRTGDAFVKLVPGGTNINTKGSMDNIERLLAGNVQFAIVQLDAWGRHLTKNPGDTDKIEELGSLYKECLYLATSVDSGITSDDSLQSKGKTVAIGKVGSGTWATWRYMGELEYKFLRASVSPKYGTRALISLLATKSKIDAVAWVARPDINNKMLVKVRNNPKLTMAPVDDMNLNNNHPTLKEPIYTFEKLVVDDSGVFDAKVKTICTKAVILTRSDNSDKLLDAASEVMLTNLSTLIK